MTVDKANSSDQTELKLLVCPVGLAYTCCNYSNISLRSSLETGNNNNNNNNNDDDDNNNKKQQ